MPPQPADGTQRLSKTLFGQVHRLAVMEAIARSEDGLINPGDLADDLGFRAQSAIQAPLRDLEEAGLLVRLPTHAGRTYYQRQDSLAWPWAIELVEGLSDSSSRSKPSAAPSTRT